MSQRRHVWIDNHNGSFCRLSGILRDNIHIYARIFEVPNHLKSRSTGKAIRRFVTQLTKVNTNLHNGFNTYTEAAQWVEQYKSKLEIATNYPFTRIGYTIHPTTFKTDLDMFTDDLKSLAAAKECGEIIAEVLGYQEKAHG